MTTNRVAPSSTAPGFRNTWASCGLGLALLSTPALFVTGVAGFGFGVYEPFGLLIPFFAIWIGLLGMRDASLTNGVGEWRAAIGITTALLSIALYEWLAWEWEHSPWPVY